MAFALRVGSALVYRPAKAVRPGRRAAIAAVVCDGGCVAEARSSLVANRRRLALGTLRRTVPVGGARGLRVAMSRSALRLARRARARVVTRVTVADATGRQTAVLRLPVRR